MTEERKIRGLHYEEKGTFGTALSVAADADRSWDDTGFRLVHDDESRVYRGGSWVFSADVARAASRGRFLPGGRGGSLGFRLVREGT